MSAVAADSLGSFHPLVAEWFLSHLGAPSDPQQQAWPLIQEGRNVLLAAPTGSGKTLAAFLSSLDSLVRDALAGTLEPRTRVVYVSPLKALSNDVQKNLIRPLEELRALAEKKGLELPEIRVGLRTGDTSHADRAAMLRRPPHLLVTTPESLYLCLTSEKARQTLRQVETVIVDEIHALARDKRGSHLSLTLERLKAQCESTPKFIGLSATQKPLETIAEFLCGRRDDTAVPCELVKIGHQRPWDIRIETPDDELAAVPSNDAWGQVYARLAELSESNRTVLVFVNTRRLAERVAHDLQERIGEGLVCAHHGSMSRDLRLVAEEKLKRGELRVMVATASLELGIDIGTIDVVCQIGSPRAISVALQRIGRAGHWAGGVSKGIFFAMTLDELVECTAVMRAIREGELDRVILPEQPLDILSQQLVAACACDEWDEDALFVLSRRAFPFRELTREKFDGVLTMLSEGVNGPRGRASALLHWDRVNRKVRARRGARIRALTNVGAIPDTFTFPVVLVPEDRVIGSLDEEFAIESMAGDVFLLGSSSWRFLRVSEGKVYVEDAHGAPPSAPLWAGEAPARTEELSVAVGKLREDIAAHEAPVGWLRGEWGLTEKDAKTLHGYIAATNAALGGVPTSASIIVERFFDETGGMQLVIHAPLGGRINRAWGMALRKKFCRNFDFELQAAATDDGVLLSLSDQHSFPLEDILAFLNADTVEKVLVQAVLQAPLFGTRFRWNATRSLALSRTYNGKRIPPQVQRSRSDDLMAAVFPAQVGCQDNHGGAEIEPPDHPLVDSVLYDCLHEAMDVRGLETLLRAVRSGTMKTRAVDTPEPSPMSHAILVSHPGTYLDDAPLEERRARAITLRRGLPAADAVAFGALDDEAIATVVSDAQPSPRDADELHDVLLGLGYLRETDVSMEQLAPLLKAGRAVRARVTLKPAEDVEVTSTFVVARERLRAFAALHPEAVLTPAHEPLPHEKETTPEDAAHVLVRGWMECVGPISVQELAHRIGLDFSRTNEAMHRLESSGQVLRGKFRRSFLEENPEGTEWCDRRLLKRIHGLTVGRLRRDIEPLSAQDFMRFLFRWHHLEGDDGLRGKNGLLKAVSLLEGYEAPASVWESALLPSRMHRYEGELLERACWDGEVAWARLSRKERATRTVTKRGVITSPAESWGERALPGRPNRSALLSFVRRDNLDWMLEATRESAVEEPELDAKRSDDASIRAAETPGNSADERSAVTDVLRALERRGALFFKELVALTRRLPNEIEDALWELLARGDVTADALENLHVLLSPGKRKRQSESGRGGPGRWSLLRPFESYDEETLLQERARMLLRRYGVVWRDLLAREPLAVTWRELAGVYRRMEARGEIRGGRFVSGFTGEQFALNDAVEVARAVRRAPKSGAVLHLSACDPLNLTGIVTPGARVPAIGGTTVSYRDGLPLSPEDALSVTAYPSLLPMVVAVGTGAVLPGQGQGANPATPFRSRPLSKDIH